MGWSSYRLKARLSCEQLEERAVPAVLRVATYNIAADVNGTTPLPGLYEVLEGIGEEQVQGNVRPLDIVALQETTSNATTVDPIVSNLNSYYNGLAVYARSTYQGTQNGSPTVGNGPNAVVYNTSTLNLLSSVGVGTPAGTSNGEYRQVVRYEFQPIGDTGTTGIFYVYDAHSKSGSTTTDATYRNDEAVIIRNDEATNLASTDRVLYVGDFNLGNSTDASYQTMVAAGSQGAGIDPDNPQNLTQNYALNATYQGIMSESSKNLRYRDDFQYQTQNVYNATPGGLSYVSGSYHSFGNNGTTPEGGNVNSGSNTSLNSDLVQDGGTFISAATLYSDLTTGSDHLPVVADYTIPTGTSSPTIGSFTVSPTSVAVGGTITLTASNVSESGGTISSLNFYRESNGTAGLQVGSDTLVGSGTPSGTTWALANMSTTGLAAGSYTYYAVATDSTSVSSAASSATLTITGPSTPSIGSFTVSPTAVTVGGTINLTASNVVESGGTIGSVNFYRESNGTAGLQVGGDTLVGSGTPSGSTWTLTNVSTTGLAAGSYTYYAVATDSASVSSPASSATLTITNPTTSGVLLAWDVNGQANYGTQGLAATQVASGVSNVLGLTRGSAVTTSGTAASNAWGGNGWASSSAAGITGNQFVTFGLTVGTGELASLSSVDLFYRHSGTGPANGYWQYQINGGAWNLIGDFAGEFPSSSSSGAAMAELNLAGIGGLQNLSAGTAVTLQLVPYGATSTAGTWYVDNTSGNDLVVNGSTAAVATTTTAVAASPVSPTAAGSPITFTASINGGTAQPTGTVTFSYTHNSTTTPLGSVTLTAAMNGIASLAPTSSLPIGVDTITAIYSGDAAHAGSPGTLNQTITAPAVSLIVIGGIGSGASGSAHSWSQLTQATITFTGPVVLAAESSATPAFTLTGTDANGNSTNVANTDILVSNPSGDKTIYALTFQYSSGDSGVDSTFQQTVQSQVLRSLADGKYVLAVHANAVTAANGNGAAMVQDADTAAAGLAGINHLNIPIRRLAGDGNGDGTVDGTDFAAFGNTFGLSPTDSSWAPAYDLNGDGTVDGTDFALFGNRFGLSDI